MTKIRGGLVQHDERAVRQQNAGDDQQLGLAGGELQPVEIFVQPAGAAFGQADPGQRLFQRGVALLAQGGEIRTQGAEEGEGDLGDGVIECAHCLRRQGRERLIAVVDLPLGYRIHGLQHPEQGALARPCAATDTHLLAGGQLEVDPVQGPLAGTRVAQSQVVETHRRMGRGEGLSLLTLALYLAVFTHPLHCVHHLFHLGEGTDQGVEHGRGGEGVGDGHGPQQRAVAKGHHQCHCPHQGGGEQGLVHAEPAVDGGGGVPAAQVVVIVMQHLIQGEAFGPGQTQGGGTANGLADADVERGTQHRGLAPQLELHCPVAPLQHVERPAHQGGDEQQQGNVDADDHHLQQHRDQHAEQPHQHGQQHLLGLPEIPVEAVEDAPLGHLVEEGHGGAADATQHAVEQGPGQLEAEFVVDDPHHHDADEGARPQQHIDAEQGAHIAHLGLAAEPEIRGDAQPLLTQGEQQGDQDGAGGGQALPHEAEQPPVHLAFHHFFFAELLRLLRRHHGGGERMLDKIRQLAGVELHQPALLDTDHPIAVGKHIRIVAHQQPGRSRFEGEPLLQHLGRDDRVQCRQGVVQQQDVGLCIEGAGQSDPLLLTAGEAGAELTHQGPIPVAQQSQIRGEGAGTEHPVVALLVPGLAEQNVVADAVVHQPGFVAQMRHPAVAVDAPLEVVVKTGDQVQQAALARAGRPGDPHQLPRLDAEADVLQHHFLLVQGGDAV